MSERGYIKLKDASGRRIYDEFSIDSLETVAFTLSKDSFGTASVHDLSSASHTAYFRASVKGTATIPIDVALSNVTDGTDGKVTGSVTFRTADFAAPLKVECAVVIVNTSVVDALTESGYEETIWEGRWIAYIREGMHE